MARSWRNTNRYTDVTPRPIWNGDTGVDKPLPPLAPPVLPVIQPQPKPVLEINERSRRDLRRLIDLIGQRGVERALNVHRTTVGRWLQGRVPLPGGQWQAVRSLLGDLPGAMGRWHGWRFHDGELLSPAGDRYTPGEVLSLRLRTQQANELMRENRDLRLRIKVLEQTLDHLGPAANHSQTA